MNTAKLVAQHLLDVYKGNNWTEVNIADTLKDVTLSEAIIVTEASSNTIAALVHHLAFWNRAMTARLKGLEMKIPEDNGYCTPELKTEADWQRIRNDNLASATERAETISNIDKERLFQPIVPGRSSIYKNVQGMVEHIHYHLGQIVILKKLIRRQLRGEG
jgi:uncharacterized damage-inducible protein DinB